jgi:hypothetical protein
MHNGMYCCTTRVWSPTQSLRKPTGPKTEASEFEVGPVKIENQEVRLAFGFYQTFYNIVTLGGL